MATNKNKKKRPVKSSNDVIPPDVIPPDDDIPFPPDDDIPFGDPESTSTPEKEPQDDVGEELLKLSIAAWKVKTTSTLILELTRCFQHFAAGKTYPMEKVFRQLDLIQDRLPDDFISQFSKFEEMLIAEYVARKSNTV
jgi:hypothetical protein